MRLLCLNEEVKVGFRKVEGSFKVFRREVLERIGEYDEL